MYIYTYIYLCMYIMFEHYWILNEFAKFSFEKSEKDS